MWPPFCGGGDQFPDRFTVRTCVLPCACGMCVLPVVRRAHFVRIPKRQAGMFIVDLWLGAQYKRKKKAHSIRGKNLRGLIFEQYHGRSSSSSCSPPPPREGGGGGGGGGGAAGDCDILEGSTIVGMMTLSGKEGGDLRERKSGTH